MVWYLISILIVFFCLLFFFHNNLNSIWSTFLIFSHHWHKIKLNWGFWGFLSYPLSYKRPIGVKSKIIYWLQLYLYEKHALWEFVSVWETCPVRICLARHNFIGICHEILFMYLQNYPCKNIWWTIFLWLLSVLAKNDLKISSETTSNQSYPDSSLEDLLLWNHFKPILSWLIIRRSSLLKPLQTNLNLTHH